MGKQVVSVDDILEAAQRADKRLNVRQGDCIVTPGAWDKIEELGVVFADDSSGPQPVAAENGTKAQKVGKGQMDEKTLSDQVSRLLRAQLPNVDREHLELLVAKACKAKLSGKCSGAASTAAPVSNSAAGGGVSIISSKELLGKVNGPAVPGKVTVSDVVRPCQGSSCAVTFMEWEKASFNRTLEATEIDLVVEGDLIVKVNGKSMKAGPGDVLYLKEGVSVVYSTSSKVKLTCINV